MLTIKAAAGDIPTTATPGSMLTVELKIETSSTTFEIDMDIEDLNDATRHHKGKSSDLRVFHMMCERSTRAQQKAVLKEIAADPGSFYRQLFAANKSLAKPPLTLFEDKNPTRIWPPVIHSLKEAEAAILSVLDLLSKRKDRRSLDFVAAATPCFALIISQDPDHLDLLDASMTAVIHS